MAERDVLWLRRLDDFVVVRTLNEVRADRRRLERERRADRYRKQASVLRLHESGRDYIDCTG